MRRFLILLGIVFCISGCASGNSHIGKVTDFAYTDEEGKRFASSSLAGEPWIANFIFTNCETVCPPMMASTEELREQLRHHGISIQVVSFSVDPAADTPEILRDYQGKFTQDRDKWTMLTGYSQQEIETFARETFQTLIHKPDGSDQVIHSTSFYLVNSDGYFLDSYGFQQTHIKRLVNDIQELF